MAKKKTATKKKPLHITDQEAIKGKDFATIESSHEHNVESLKQILDTFIKGDNLIMIYKPSGENKKAKKYFASRPKEDGIEFAMAVMIEASPEVQYNAAKHLEKLSGGDKLGYLMSLLSAINGK